MRLSDLTSAVQDAPECVRGIWFSTEQLAAVLDVLLPGFKLLLSQRSSSSGPAAAAGLDVDRIQLDYGGPILKFYYIRIKWTAFFYDNALG